MSVTLVEESSVGDSLQSTGIDAASATTNYRTHYRVTAERGDSSEVVRQYFKNNIGLPFNGRNFDFGNGFNNKSKCKELNISNIDKSEGRFLAEAIFEESAITLGDLAQKDGESNPFKWHDELSVSTTQISTPVYGATFTGAVNAQGQPVNCSIQFGQVWPVMNSAFVTLDPPIEEELDILVFRLTKFQPGYNPNFINTYLNTVNQHVVFIHKPAYGFSIFIPERKAKMKAVHSDFAITDKGIKYWRHTLEVHVNPQGWRRPVLDQGLEQAFKAEDQLPNGRTISASDLPVDEAGNRAHHATVPIEDPITNTPIVTPVPFNGLGKMLINDGRPRVFLYWATLREVNWSGIGW